jgi:hypothetical protein
MAGLLEGDLQRIDRHHSHMDTGCITSRPLSNRRGAQSTGGRFLRERSRNDCWRERHSVMSQSELAVAEPPCYCEILETDVVRLEYPVAHKSYFLVVLQSRLICSTAIAQMSLRSTDLFSLLRSEIQRRTTARRFDDASEFTESTRKRLVCRQPHRRGAVAGSNSTGSPRPVMGAGRPRHLAPASIICEAQDETPG